MMTSPPPTPPGLSPSAPLGDRVLALSRGLHARGFPVALAETLDAIAAIDHIDLLRRHELRECLRATLVKQADVHRDFDVLFERHFPRKVGSHIASVVSDVDLSIDGLVEALLGDDDLADVAAGLVEEHGGLDGDVRGERHHAQRVLRAADLARLMMLALRDRDDVDLADMRARLEELKRLIVADVRGRVGERGEDIAVDEVESIEFLRASRTELERMRSAVRPLARRIATRLARRRQHASSGRIDMRRTVRRSLATGGVPFDVVERRRKPHRPELFVLCDISGSVAEFSLFTLTLVASLSAELPRTRSFVFVDAIDEITDLLAKTGHRIEPWQIMRNTNVIGATGHSDYGRVFTQFWDEIGEWELTRSSTVLITGDGRCNYRPAEASALARIAARAKSTFWLDPEPMREWYVHDSEMETYAEHCTAQFEVRDLHQLSHAVERII